MLFFTPFICSFHCFFILKKIQHAISQLSDQVSQSHQMESQQTWSLSELCQMESPLFNTLLEASSMADEASPLFVSALHAASWLSVVPSPSLDLHLEPKELLPAYLSCGDLDWTLHVDSCALCALRKHWTMQLHVVKARRWFCHLTLFLVGYCGSPLLSGPHWSVSWDWLWSYTITPVLQMSW